MQSETIGAIAAALAKAQGEIRPAPMDRDNPFFKSKYATLTSLWESARPALSANGLAVTQVTDFDAAGDLVLLTTLLHSSGEWIGGVYPIRTADTKPQTLGSAISYARRYALGALIGLTSDDDDDGNAATQGAQKAQPAQRAEQEAPRNSTPRAAANHAPATGNARTNGGAAGNGQAARWASAADAYAWAVESGACENEFEAQTSMKIVAAQFGGRLTKENMAAAMDAFHARQMEKLHDKAAEVTLNAVPEVDPEGVFN